MEYISVKEYAEKYNLDSGWVRYLIRKGRIKAVKIGKSWSIPADESRPEDLRVKFGK